MLDLVNSLVEEKADIISCEEVPRVAEADSLAGVLSRFERGQELYIVVEAGMRVVAIPRNAGRAATRDMSPE